MVTWAECRPWPPTHYPEKPSEQPCEVGTAVASGLQAVQGLLQVTALGSARAWVPVQAQLQPQPPCHLPLPGGLL